ncbi:MAG: signal recognition particle-docking protein FtsY [Pseudanabaena sp. ELA607]
MVFNWFRRQFDGKDSTPSNEVKDTSATPTEPSTSEAQATPEPDSATPQAPEPAENETSAPEVTVAPNVSPELLNWAKAAYVNIQKQELDTKEPTSEVTEPSTPTPLAEVTSEIVSEVVAEPEIAATTVIESTPAPLPESSLEPPSIIASPITTTPEPETVTPVAAAPEEATIENLLVNDPALTLETTPEKGLAEEVSAAAQSTPDVPFWLQNADREARIASLEATAIIDDVPPPVSTTPKPRKPTITFDDTFLWSAEVLAAQGRKPEDISVEEISWLNRLQQGLGKTRIGLVNQLKSLVGQGPLSPEAVDEIEMLLLQADVGVKATDAIIAQLQDKLRRDILPPEQAIAYLKDLLRQMLDNPLAATNNQPAKSEMLIPDKNQLNIWLITGVNGAGKTTTIGKLTHLAVKSGYKTLIAAADTFRAAAVEQVKTWGDRSAVEVIANLTQNADPAAVVFDALSAAESRGTELLLVDTAGRLQNKQNLMDELAKIRRIIDKKNKSAKIESLLVLDATLGQNGLKQAEVFTKAAGITGVILTKLDGTAKGGVAFGVVQQLNLPIRFIGAGEGIEDLRPFSSYEFVEALLR